MEDIDGLADSLRETFYTDRTLPISWRLAELRALRTMCFENEAEICAALKSDLNKPCVEAKMSELGMVFHDIDEALDNLSSWMAPESVSVPLVNKMDGCQIRKDPIGVVLIIAPWNYPIQLTLVPLVGAIAAGCPTVIKPSELAPATAEILAELVPRYLDPECFRVVNGAVPETTALLAQKWDHILYTGGEMVARIVMRAAAEHLTPVTLELGGKSPCIVDGTGSMRTAARRIMWGRLLNSGQSCIAPDYILIDEASQERFIEECRNAIRAFYGENPKESDSYGRMINERHFDRVMRLIDVDRDHVAIGGESDRSEKYIAPTVMRDCTPDMAVMQEEIFGPVLPIITVPSVDAAVAFVNERPKPLALYVFSVSNRVAEDVLTRTSSGSAVVNDTMMQASVSTLPFGGVGISGMGAYHGKHSYDLFSHDKAVMRKGNGLEFANDMRYPPYTDGKFRTIAWILGYPSSAVHSSSPVKLIFIAFALLSMVAYLFFKYGSRASAGAAQ